MAFVLCSAFATDEEGRMGGRWQRIATVSFAQNAHAAEPEQMGPEEREGWN